MQIAFKRMPASLSNHMFLDRDIQSTVDHIRQTHERYFLFVERLNELAHHALFSAKVVRSDMRQLLLATLLQRALTAFQATVILAQRGMPSEVRVVLRTLLEAMFRIAAIANDEDVAHDYVQAHEHHRLNFVKKLKRLPKALRPQVDETALESLRVALAKSVNGLPETALTTKWFAEKAELENFYNTAYALLSEDVHINVGTLESALNIDEQEELVSFSYGPSDEEIEHHLLTAAEALLLSMRAAFSVLEVACTKEVEQMHEEFVALHADFTSET